MVILHIYTSITIGNVQEINCSLCADVGNKPDARQNNPSVDFEYDKNTY